MEKLRHQFEVSFSTKVVVPVVGTMVLLIAITVSIVNTRLTSQFQTEASRSLAHAEESVRKSRELHWRQQLGHFSSLPDEPKYRALFTLGAGDAPTIKGSLDEIRTNKEVDMVLYSKLEKVQEPIASSRKDCSALVPEFETACASLVEECFRNEEERMDTVQVGYQLFDVICVPVRGGGRDLIGALTLGTEIVDRTAQDLKEATQCEIILLRNGRVIASTARRPELHEQFAKIFAATVAEGGKTSESRKVPLGDEHYFCSAGHFSPGEEGKLGYLLLASYEQPLRSLRITQQILAGVSGVGVLLAAGIVWLLVRKVTAPLRDLSASAEAVGQGDFSQRVEVKSRDECGELATVFNQMTENLKRSREQLETTVETLKTTQAQLVQSEKLSGIGEFVAGVAHELNNPLTSVMGFSELLARAADQDPQQKRHLELIYKSAQRCQKIVQSLLSFARRHQPERKLSSINELVEAAVDFLAYQLRTSNIEIITRLEKYLPKALVDPHQLQQVFLNLINNARQALEGSPTRGVIRISTESCARTIRVVIQDNGPGIPEQNLSKVFDPFFTTKEVGKGTGLGLSLCYGIVKEHGGSIIVRSKIGEGAAFVIELPLAEEDPDEAPAEKKLQRKPLKRTERLEGAGRKILVIDDEEAILEMVRETLAEQGYEVDVARDGESALNRVQHKRYDLALCDWKMPGLNGRQVYERLASSHPELSDRLIFITGDVINEKTEAFLRSRNKICLSKPFSLVDFRAAIGKALKRA